MQPTIDLGPDAPESGEVQFIVPVAPVSFQASPAKKRTVVEAVRAVVRTAGFIFTDDVQVDLLWSINERDRYERDSSADVDNIIKPILDAMSGPDGIMVNDCQVQWISSSWVHSEGEEQITIRVKLVPLSDPFSKRDIYFVHLGNQLCWPLDGSLPLAVNRLLVDNLKERLRFRDEAAATTGSRDAARYLMPSQRFFHRSRLQGFRVVEARAIETAVA
jgi:Holliday junction resolvase RusA-like endonuclease